MSACVVNNPNKLCGFQTLNQVEDTSLVANAFGFLRTPLVFNPYDMPADVAITGVPFDIATSGRSGSRFGPQAIRNISTQLDWEHCRYPWDFCLKDKLKIMDCGDLVYSFGDAKSMAAALEAHTLKLLESGKTCLTFGGDHFITLPLLRAHYKHFCKNGEKLSLLHFDAHSDTYSNGSDADHGTMFYHAPMEGLIDPNRSVQLGIRTEYDKSLGFNVIHGAMANDLSVDEIVASIEKTVGDNKVYLTFDIDCLDPAYAPGTGTPVCGGLSTDKILKIIRKLTKLNIVGYDVVEVAPVYDHAEITALAAATLATDMLYLHASKRQYQQNKLTLALYKPFSKHQRAALLFLALPFCTLACAFQAKG